MPGVLLGILTAAIGVLFSCYGGSCFWAAVAAGAVNYFGVLLWVAWKSDGELF